MNQTVKEEKLTLPKSCQDWREGFHWRWWGRRDYLFLALKASCQKISSFISSHLNFFLSSDAALRNDWIFYHLVFFWNIKRNWSEQICQIFSILLHMFYDRLSFSSNFESFMFDLDGCSQTYISRSTKCYKNPLAITERIYSGKHPQPIILIRTSLHIFYHKILRQIKNKHWYNLRKHSLYWEPFHRTEFSGSFILCDKFTCGFSLYSNLHSNDMTEWEFFGE